MYNAILFVNVIYYWNSLWDGKLHLKFYKNDTNNLDLQKWQ